MKFISILNKKLGKATTNTKVEKINLNNESISPENIESFIRENIDHKYGIICQSSLINEQIKEQFPDAYFIECIWKCVLRTKSDTKFDGNIKHYHWREKNASSIIYDLFCTERIDITAPSMELYKLMYKIGLGIISNLPEKYIKIKRNLVDLIIPRRVKSTLIDFNANREYAIGYYHRVIVDVPIYYILSFDNEPKFNDYEIALINDTFHNIPNNIINAITELETNIFIASNFISNNAFDDEFVAIVSKYYHILYGNYLIHRRYYGFLYKQVISIENNYIAPERQIIRIAMSCTNNSSWDNVGVNENANGYLLMRK